MRCGMFMGGGGGGYISDNYQIVDENMTYTLYGLREKLK